MPDTAAPRLDLPDVTLLDLFSPFAAMLSRVERVRQNAPGLLAGLSLAGDLDQLKAALEAEARRRLTTLDDGGFAAVKVLLAEIAESAHRAHTAAREAAAAEERRRLEAEEREAARVKAEAEAEERRRQGAWAVAEHERQEAERRKWEAYEADQAAYRDWKKRQGGKPAA